MSLLVSVQSVGVVVVAIVVVDVGTDIDRMSKSKQKATHCKKYQTNTFLLSADENDSITNIPMKTEVRRFWHSMSNVL